MVRPYIRQTQLLLCAQGLQALESVAIHGQGAFGQAALHTQVINVSINQTAVG